MFILGIQLMGLFETTKGPSGLSVPRITRIPDFFRALPIENLLEPVKYHCDILHQHR